MKDGTQQPARLGETGDSIELEAGEPSSASFLCRFKGTQSDLERLDAAAPSDSDPDFFTTNEPIDSSSSSLGEVDGSGSGSGSGAGGIPSSSSSPAPSLDSLINDLIADDKWRSLGLGWQIADDDPHVAERLESRSAVSFRVLNDTTTSDSRSFVVLVANLTLTHIGSIHQRIWTCRFGSATAELPITVRRKSPRLNNQAALWVQFADLVLSDTCIA